MSYRSQVPNQRPGSEPATEEDLYQCFRETLPTGYRQKNTGPRDLSSMIAMMISLSDRVEALEKEKRKYQQENDHVKQSMAVLEKADKEKDTRIIELEKAVRGLKLIADLSKATKKADVQQKRELIKDPFQVLYCRTFYHAINDLFDTYRSVNTDLVVANEEVKEQTGRKFAKGIAKGASVILGSVPIIGKIAEYAKDIANWRVEQLNKKEFKLDTEAVCSFLRYNNDQNSELEEDIGLSCFDVAIKLAELRKDDIIFVRDAENLKKLKKSEDSWFRSFWKLISEEVQDNMDLEKKAVYCLAIKDVTMVLAHIYQFSEEMKKKGDISAQFIKIVMESPN